MAKNFLDINGNVIEDVLCAETDSHGLMCPEDKAKLDSIDPDNLVNKQYLDTAVLITEEEIDAICGNSIKRASEVTF